MRFAIYSTEGTGLCWWKRLKDEGHEVLVYIKPTAQKQIGDGLVDKTGNYASWAEWGKNGIYFFDGSGAGYQANLLRRAGRKVVGAGSFCDKLESERGWTQSLYEGVGVKSPDTKEFKTISAALSYAKGHSQTWVFKTNRYLEASATYVADDQQDLVRYLEYMRWKWGDNIPNILQEKLPGFALSTARWWNGKAWTGPYEGTIEHKKFMNDDIGGSTGCSFNMVWFYQEEPEIARSLQFDKQVGFMRANEAPPGLYDVNALLHEDDGEAYFLEITPRLGYDSEPTSQRGIRDLGKLLSDLAQGGEVGHLFDASQVYCSVRLTVSPYPWEHIEQDAPPRHSCIGTPIAGADGIWNRHFVGYGVSVDPTRGLVVADPGGIVGLAVAAGPSPDSAYDEVYKYIDRRKGKLRIPNLQYRTDAKAKVLEDLRTISDLGYDTYL